MLINSAYWSLDDYAKVFLNFFTWKLRNKWHESKRKGVGIHLLNLRQIVFFFIYQINSSIQFKRIYIIIEMLYAFDLKFVHLNCYNSYIKEISCICWISDSMYKMEDAPHIELKHVSSAWNAKYNFMAQLLSD